MPALKARSPIVAMERSPLSEAQTARLLAAECHRFKSEYSFAGYEYDVLKKIQAAEGRVLAISEGRDPDSESNFLKVPYARSRYLSGKAGEMARKVCDLHQEITRSPLPQLSVLGTTTESERVEITFQLQAQEFKDGTVFMKQGWHGESPCADTYGLCRLTSCVLPEAQGSLSLGPMHGTCALRVLVSGVPYVPRTVAPHSTTGDALYIIAQGEVGCVQQRDRPVQSQPTRAALLERPSAPAPQRLSAPAPERLSA
jgi:hypothetical protein